MTTMTIPGDRAPGRHQQEDPIPPGATQHQAHDAWVQAKRDLSHTEATVRSTDDTLAALRAITTQPEGLVDRLRGIIRGE